MKRDLCAIVCVSSTGLFVDTHMRKATCVRDCMLLVQVFVTTWKSRRTRVKSDVYAIRDTVCFIYRSLLLRGSLDVHMSKRRVRDTRYCMFHLQVFENTSDVNTSNVNTQKIQHASL